MGLGSSVRNFSIEHQVENDFSFLLKMVFNQIKEMKKKQSRKKRGKNEIIIFLTTQQKEDNKKLVYLCT